MQKVQKPELSNESWNKKRIFLVIFSLVVLFIGFIELKSYVLGSDLEPSVKSASISPAPTISLPSAQNITAGLGQNLNNIKQEINNINVQDLATSSPQVQKVLNDIKALPNVPGEQAKDMCLKICNGL